MCNKNVYFCEQLAYFGPGRQAQILLDKEKLWRYFFFFGGGGVKGLIHFEIQKISEHKYIAPPTLYLIRSDSCLIHCLASVTKYVFIVSMGGLERLDQ